MNTPGKERHDADWFREQIQAGLQQVMQPSSTPIACENCNGEHFSLRESFRCILSDSIAEQEVETILDRVEARLRDA